MSDQSKTIQIETHKCNTDMWEKQESKARGEKSFLQSVCKLAIPVALQCMLQSSFSMIDQVMIGQLGSISITAVGIAGKFSSIYSVIATAISTVAGIMIAQYIGAGEEEESFKSFWVNTLAAMAVAAVFTVLSICLAGPILEIYTTDQAAIAEGAVYLRIISFTFIPMAISSIAATWLRCHEKASLPLYASFLAVLCNTGLNYVLIFGKLGLPRLQSKGAGYATLISQLVNMLLMVIGMLWCVKKEQKKTCFSIRLEKMTKNQYLVMLLPILLTEFLWSLGENVYAVIYGHLGTNSFAAMTLTGPVQGLFIGALSGLSGAAAVLIGKELGKKNFEKAYKDGKKLVLYGIIGALGLSVLLILLSGFYVSIYHVEEEVKQTARLLLIAFAVYAPVKVTNMILGGGIIRSGGNTKLIMYIDIIGTWGFGVPLGFLAAYVLKWSIPYVYLLLSFEEVIRLLMEWYVFRHRKWMHYIGE